MLVFKTTKLASANDFACLCVFWLFFVVMMLYIYLFMLKQHHSHHLLCLMLENKTSIQQIVFNIVKNVKFYSFWYDVSGDQTHNLQVSVYTSELNLFSRAFDDWK